MEELEFVLCKLKEQGCSEEFIAFLHTAFIFFKRKKFLIDIQIVRG